MSSSSLFLHHPISILAYYDDFSPMLFPNSLCSCSGSTAGKFPRLKCRPPSSCHRLATNAFVPQSFYLRLLVKCFYFFIFFIFIFSLETCSGVSLPLLFLHHPISLLGELLFFLIMTISFHAISGSYVFMLWIYSW